MERTILYDDAREEFICNLLYKIKDQLKDAENEVEQDQTLTIAQKQHQFTTKAKKIILDAKQFAIDNDMEYLTRYEGYYGSIKSAHLCGLLHSF